MKTHRFLAVAILACATFGLSIERARAQDAADVDRAPSGVRVIDIASIYKRHLGFKADVAELKKELKATEERLQSEVDEVKAMAKVLAKLKEGSEEYARVEREAQKKRLDFNLKAKRIKTDFLKREASLYYKRYREIQQQVRVYCEAHDVSLVIRFQDEVLDEPTTREELQKVLVRPVVYQKGIDITDTILDALKAQAKKDGKPWSESEEL